MISKKKLKEELRELRKIADEHKFCSRFTYSDVDRLTIQRDNAVAACKKLAKANEKLRERINQRDAIDNESKENAVDVNRWT